MSTTIDLYAGDYIKLGDALDDDGDLSVKIHDEEAGDAASYINSEAAQEIIDVLTERFDIAPEANLPAGAVRAKDIPLNEALIRVAAAHDAEISFRYAKGDGSPVEARTFAPQSVRVMPDHVTFVGYDPDRGGMRSFRSDRIKGLVAVNA